MRMKLGFLLLLAAASASGQTVFKCRDGRGAVVYQSDACAGGSAEKQWTTVPGLQDGGAASVDAPISRAEADLRIEHAREALQRSNVQRRGATTAVEVRIGGPACGTAKNARDAAHKAAGVRWSYAQASFWDRQVFDACK